MLAGPRALIGRRRRRRRASAATSAISSSSRPALSTLVPGGTTAVVKPSLTASFSRSSAWGAGTDIARQADLPEKHAIPRQGPAGQGGNQGRRRGQIGRRLADLQPAGDVQIDVMARDAEAGAGIQHGQDHRQPPRIPAHDGAARRAVAGRGDQRLDLDQQGPRAFEPGEHRARPAPGPSGRPGTARTDWRLRQGRAPSSRRRRSRRWGRSGSSPRAARGSDGRARPRNRARHRPDARPAWGRRSGPPW